MTDTAQYRIRASGAGELVARVEGAVASGELAPGERLPSVRRLAAEVGLSPVTVSAALAELRRRGIVVTEPRRGTRVGSAPPLGAPLPPPVPAGARDLSSGNPDPELLPDLSRALGALPRRAGLYGEAPVIEELASVAVAELRADGVPAAEVCVTSGALDALERVLAARLRAGDRVAVESPGYAAQHDLLRALGLGLAPVPVDDRGMLPGELAAALADGAAAVVLTPRGQNPTGAALDAGRARELAAVLGDHPRALVVEDDHLGPVAGATFHTLVAGRERWAVARSVAKALGPDLRLAVLAGDEQTLARVQGRQRCGPGWVSRLLQEIVVELWRDPAATAAVAAARDAYALRRRALLSELAALGVPAQGRSGLNIWIPVSEEAAVVAALLARGWVLAPGARFRLGDAPPGVRVTTAALDPALAPELARDIHAALAPALRRSA